MRPTSRLSAAAPLSGEPVDRMEPATGSPADGALASAIAIAAAWAGPELEALLLGGSHASGEGVWVDHAGTRRTLSDLDLYAILPDERACRAGEARARAERPGLAARLAATGLEAPLEVAFLTREGLSRMVARPGTLELARHGRVVRGDAGVLALVPRPDPREIPAEEAQLLLENRAFELLLARPELAAADPLARMRARHAVLKSAADLATVLALETGELPGSAAARIDWARASGAASRFGALPAPWCEAAGALEELWRASIAWRSGDVRALAAGEGEAEWRAAALAWSAVWWQRTNGGTADPWARALASARRAPWRRRVRQALATGERSGGTMAHLAHVAAGSPQHRVNASAAVLLLAATLDPAADALPAPALAVLRRLGVTRAHDASGAAREVVRAWDQWVLDGRRTAVGA